MINKFFYTLFSGNSSIVAGDMYATTPDLMGNIVSRSEITNYQLFTVNSIHPSIDFGYGINPDKYQPNRPRRADINASSLNNFMFEIDCLPLDEQLEFLYSTGIPWTSIVFSGNKSYHAILSLENNIAEPHTEEGVKVYKQVWKQLAAYMNHLYGSDIIDPTTLNPAQFTRFPNSVRYIDDKHNKQTLEFFGKSCSDEDFRKILKKCPKPKVLRINNIYVPDFANNEEQFWALCSKGLYGWITNPSQWAKSEGNYERLRDIAYWTKREITKDVELLLAIMDRDVFPTLVNAGYPIEKIELRRKDIRRIFQEN